MKHKRRKKRRPPGALRQRLESFAVKMAVATFGRLSPPARARLARGLGALASRCLPFRRTLVLDNLRRAFPDWTEARRRELLPAIYANLFALGFEILGMEHLTPAQLEAGVQLEETSRARVEALRASGAGFVVLTAHFGNWEWLGAFMISIGFDVGTWAKPMHNPTTEALIRSQRERIGYSVFYPGQSPLRLFRHVRKGGIIALLADQDARGDGIFLPFFGYPASTATGAPWVAVKLGVPMIAGFGFRTREGGMRAWAAEPFYPNPHADPDAEIERALRYYHEHLEIAIREDPTQYMWFHRRWKTRPKGEVQPDPARTLERVAARR